MAPRVSAALVDRDHPLRATSLLHARPRVGTKLGFGAEWMVLSGILASAQSAHRSLGLGRIH